MSEPLNVKLSPVDKIIQEDDIKEVTSNFIKSSSTNSFHPQGLFSEEIFGEVVSEQRLTTFGYITLNAKVFHPTVYKNLLQLKRFYGDILSSKSYAMFDNELADFVLASPDDKEAGTGFLFFLKYFSKIKFKNSDSLERKDKIEIMAKYKDDVFVEKWFVIPAGIRDIKIEDVGQSKEDINKLYSSLINLSHVIPEEGRDNPIYDNIRFSIQRKLLEIKQYIDNINSGKTGFLQKKYGARNLALGTRNVLSSASYAVTDVKSGQFLDVDESLIGVFQTIKCFQPAIIYQLKTLFFDQIFNTTSTQISVIDKVKYNLQFVPITETEKDKFLTTNGLSDIINLCKDTNYMKLPVEVISKEKVSYYLFMVYDTGDKIYYFRSLTDFISFYEETDNKFDKQLVRPLTYLELLYICAWMVTTDKHLMVTRYPVLGIGSIYPSRIHLASTSPARIVDLKIVFGDITAVVLPEYPIIDNSIMYSFAVHSSKLKGLNADF